MGMFRLEAVNVPVLGMIENMAYFTPEDVLRSITFGRDGGRDYLNVRSSIPG